MFGIYHLRPKTNEIALQNKNYTPPKSHGTRRSACGAPRVPWCAAVSQLADTTLLPQPATREVLIGGLPAGERDLTGVVIRRQQVLLLAGSVHRSMYRQA